MRDAAVPEVEEGLEQRRRHGVVVDPDTRDRGVRARMAADLHGRQVELGQERDAGVVPARVDDDHPVDPLCRLPGAIRREFLLERGDDEGLQPGMGLGEPGLDAGHQLGEERLGAEGPGGAVDHEADDVHARASQRQGGGVGAVAQLGGDGEHAVTQLGADPGSVVERERHRRLRHADPVGDVGDGRPFPRCRHPLLLEN
ncbi:hypothetical protein BO218_13680 [Microbacterium paludicola]|nr:hypothetical protein BO218_13680 [Microbacterium paludicola]